MFLSMKSSATLSETAVFSHMLVFKQVTLYQNIKINGKLSVIFFFFTVK